MSQEVHEWVNLTIYHGETIINPSSEQLAAALQELFANRDDEHPDTWIECSSDDGPLYSISVFSSGYALYSKYSDADMTDEIESLRLPNIDVAAGLALWEDLIVGKTPTAA